MIKNALLGGVDRLNGEPADAINQNETENAIINASLKGQAQIPFSILKSAGAFTNEGQLCADRTTDANGINNTINTSTTTSYFNTNLYQIDYTPETGTGTIFNPDSFLNPTNAFDNNDTTYAEKTTTSSASNTYEFGETFTSRYIAYFRVKFIFSGTSGTHDWTVQTYNGTIWTNIDSGTSSSIDKDTTYYLNNTIQGIRVTYFNGSSSSLVMRVYTINYGDFDTSSTIIADTNTLTLDGTENALSIYNDAVIPTDTSMSVVVSDGTNSTISYPLGVKTSTIIPISSLSSGVLKMTFTLATTDVTKTPEWSGYGVVIAK